MIIDATAFDAGLVFEGVGIIKRPRGVRKKFKERELLDIVGAFDIETTTLHFLPEDGKRYNDHAYMYIWMWQMGPKYTIVGRTWDQYLAVCAEIGKYCTDIKNRNGLDESPVFVSYIHNAAFEWQFLAGIYAFRDEEVFFTKPRKPLYFRMFDCLEYRCSYKLSNMSLAKFVESAGATTRKQSGQKFDYSKIRYADTVLTDEELLYCIDDVISLEEAIRLKLKRDGDTLRTVPLTSTGYVRRECKEAIAGIRKNVIEPMLPTKAQYRLLRAAFRGGNTHAAALTGMVGRVLDGVESYDMSSCYPAQQLTKPFPMSPFRMLREVPDMDRIMYFIGRGYAVVATYEFIGLTLKNPCEPVPYISVSKTKSCAYDIDGESWGVEIDNGRLIRAGYCAMTITEVDLEIIAGTYKWRDMRCVKAMVARKEPLPAQYRAVIQEYYNFKTSKKAEAKVNEAVAYMYNKIKNMLNGIYGMSAQDPIHQLIELNLALTDGMGGEFSVSDYDSDSADKSLMRANFPYQWGVYTTAYARQALQDGIRLAGDQMVYCDTDSVKTLGHVDFSEINKKRQALAEEWGACCADTTGTMHYMGVFEYEGTYKGGFITQGAKRYAYREEKGGEPEGLHVTVSGVTHRRHEYYNDNGDIIRAIPWCNEELGELSNFQPGMTWREAGGTAAVYNDLDDFMYNSPDGHRVHIRRNVAIVETTYTSEYARDYAELLKIVADGTSYKEWIKKHE